MRITVGEWSTEVDDFDGLIGKTLNVEAMAAERATGETFENLVVGLQAGSRTAITAFVWLRMKRENPALRFEDVSFAEEDFSIELNDKELERRGRGPLVERGADGGPVAADPLGADEATDALPASDSETATFPTF